MDVRLYNNTGTFEDVYDISELTAKAHADDKNATPIEVIANKVVKFLLTSKGSDAFDSDYGGVALHYGQISESFMPRFTLEMQNDVRRCKEFIRITETALDVSREKLSNIILRDIKYNFKNTPDRVDVYIEIITNKNNTAIVAVPSVG